jgi:hypothetical protein
MKQRKVTNRQGHLRKYKSGKVVPVTHHRLHYWHKFPEARHLPPKYRIHPESQKKIMMRPQRFIGLTLPPYQHLVRRKIDRFKEKILAGRSLDPPRMEVEIPTKEVLRHDGRHRMEAAKELGIEEVPVIIYAKAETGRFIKTPEGGEYKKLKPQRLREERWN